MGKVRIAFQVMDSNRASKAGQTQNQNGLAKRSSVRRIPGVSSANIRFCRDLRTVERAEAIYVAVEPARVVPVAGFVNERHIMGIATKRDDPSGVLRRNIILDGSRSGRETPRLPELFQQAPRSFGLKRTAARSRGCGCAIKLCFIPVAEALSWTPSDAYRRVIPVIRQPHVSPFK